MSYEYNRVWNIRGSGFEDIEWNLILSESAKSIEAFKGKLKGPFGEGKPTLNAYEISFSGDPGLDPFIFSRYGNFSSCDTNGLPYDDVVVSILAICKKVSSDKIEIPWFLDNSPLFRKLAAWDKLPNGWTETSVKKFWDSMTKKSPKHPVTRCMNQMDGKVTNTGAFCGSLADKADPGWRSREASVTDSVLHAIEKLEPEYRTLWFIHQSANIPQEKCRSLLKNLEKEGKIKSHIEGAGTIYYELV